jgi:hypothetical protein
MNFGNKKGFNSQWAESGPKSPLPYKKSASFGPAHGSVAAGGGPGA